MVLVFGKLCNNIGILQTKFRYREGHETRRGGPEAMPLDQHVEGGHGERQPRLKIRPAPVHDPLEMADHGQHGEHRLHQHTILPLAALTQLQVAGLPLRGMESGITQENHAFFELANQPLKLTVRPFLRRFRRNSTKPCIESQREAQYLQNTLLGAVYVSRETLRGYTKPRETI